MKFPKLESEQLVRAACVLGLLALPLMVWSVLYLVVIVRDLGIARRLRSNTDDATKS
jgi:hypothetical protein